MNDGEAGTSRRAVVTEDHDVFLNHRGPDVKATFVAHLEDALRCAGHRPFLDARSLMKGNPALQSIDHALAMANVHVAVVSRGYAESKYCLNELVAMLRSGKPVVPVFYGVEPTDLRSVENGPFAAAFERHQSRGRSPEKVQEWRDALAALAGITGFRLADYRSDESKLKREVVNQVARLSPSHILVEVDSCIVGLEGPTRRCIQVMEEMGGGIGILGIVGMGGIGKTTLAREIFNSYARESKFKHMSYLEIHRESFSSSLDCQSWLAWSLPLLRKQLMWDLLHVDSSGSMDYKNWFRKVYSVGPIMIVVDNVNDLEQFNALIPFPTSLHPGSRMIVTSRDWSILKKAVGGAGVQHFIFDVPPLDSHHTSMLFNWHAFHSMEAEEDMEGFAKDVVEACGGLPLALKVSGSSLFDKRMGEDREAIWIEARDGMRGSRDVMDVLRWSYDILQEADQRMFVDITCLFNNETREDALAYWRSCKDCVSCDRMGTPYTSLQNLINKNLVSCIDNKWLRVHDLLVELGEEIGKMAKTHFTKGDSGEVALRRKEGSTKTLALNLRESRKRRFEVEEFANMPNLHFLELPKKAKIDGDWRCMPRELRLLRWRSTTLKQVPQDFYLSKLTYLDFSWSSKLVELWSNSKCSLKGCPNLVRLNLSQCLSIKELPDSIGQSLQLQHLDLWNCRSLRKLPDTVGQLKQLQRLNLGECKKLKTLPESIGQSSQLHELLLHGCQQLERLPESIGLLQELEYLDVSDCTTLKSLPSSLGALSKLRDLDAHRCISLGPFPPSLLLCSSLSLLHLEMDPCLDSQTYFADSISEAWTQLRDLWLQDVHGLPSYLSYGAFKSLTYLIVGDKTLTEFPESIGLLVSLCYFLIQCELLECLPNSLGDLESLSWLTLDRCKNLKRLPKTFGALTNLDTLCIDNCSLFRKLPSSIGMLSSLREICLDGCKKLKKLPTSFKRLQSLNEFSLVDCENIEAMEVLTTLQGMRIWGSTSITKLPPSLGVLSNLHIQWLRSKDDWSHQLFNGTYQVLEECATGILKAYHNNSTGLLSLQANFYWTSLK